MAGATYEEIALAWKPESRRDHVFNVMMILVLAGFVLAGILISSIKLPKQKHERHVVIPERVAKFINERPKPLPKPQTKPKELPKPPPIPKQFVKPRKKEVRKPLTKVQKKARKTAKQSGLLALTKQLSDLVDTSDVDKMVGNKIHHAGKIHSEAGVSSQVLTANSGKGEVSVNQNIHSAGTGRGARLDNDQRKLARRLLASHGEIARKHTQTAQSSKPDTVRGNNLRSEEDVAYVMDEHKSMLHALYRRARRRHPGLKGKIVFEITILPSGKVSRIHVVSSELHDKALVADLAARIKQFNFGARPVETLTVTIPVEFLPS